MEAPDWRAAEAIIRAGQTISTWDINWPSFESLHSLIHIKENVNFIQSGKVWLDPENMPGLNQHLKEYYNFA
jgi:hypothetical protein